MTHHGRHRRHRTLSVVLAGLTAVVALVVATWLVSAAVYDRDPKVDTTPTGGPDAAQDAQAAVTLAVNNCRTVQRYLAPNLSAVESALEQWRVHIDAMTDLTAGRITLAQASAFWEATRVQGKRSLAAWLRTDERYRAEHELCAPPEGGGGPTEALAACHAVQRGGEAVLGAARGTLPDWRRHIRQMDALRAGTLRPTRALHLWHQMYGSGRDGVRLYDKAWRDLQGLPACPLV